MHWPSGAGNDEIIGVSGADTLLGGEGDDWLKGGNGVDKLDGGVGNDQIWAGHANDGDQVEDADMPPGSEQRGYLADRAELTSWGGEVANGVTSVSLVGGPEPSKIDDVPAQSYTFKAETALGTFEFKVVIQEGAEIDSPDQLTHVLSQMPPAYLAAASHLHDGITVVSDLGLPGIGGWASGTREIRVPDEVFTANGGDPGTLAHELTHVMGARGGEIGFWSPDAETQWEAAAKADGVPVEAYGETNYAEDMARFGELYFKAYNSPDQLAALKAASPERFSILEALASAVLN